MKSEAHLAYGFDVVESVFEGGQLFGEGRLEDEAEAAVGVTRDLREVEEEPARSKNSGITIHTADEGGSNALVGSVEGHFRFRFDVRAQLLQLVLLWALREQK